MMYREGAYQTIHKYQERIYIVKLIHAPLYSFQRSSNHPTNTNDTESFNNSLRSAMQRRSPNLPICHCTGNNDCVGEDLVIKNHDLTPPPHYGTKPGHFETSKIHCPTSEGVSEVSERAQRRARAKRAVRSKQTSERCERTDERVAQYL